MEALLQVPHAYVITLPSKNNSVHSVFVDKAMFELQMERLQLGGVEFATCELYLNSSLKISGEEEVIYLPIPPYDSAEDSQEELPEESPRELPRQTLNRAIRLSPVGVGKVTIESLQEVPKEPPQNPREELLALYQRYNDIVQERIGAEMDYEDTLKDYRKELEMHDIKSNSYEYAKNKLEEIYNIYKEDKRLYLTLLQSGESCPQPFLAKYRLFQAFSDDDEETEFRNYVEHYPDDECSGLSENFKTFFVNKDAFWKDFFSESLQERIRKELRLKYMENFYSEFELYKANKLDDPERIEFFRDLETNNSDDYEIEKLDEYIARYT